MKKIVMAAVAGGLAVAGYANAAELTLSFNGIVEDGDGPTDVAELAAGSAQLFVDVCDIGGGQVKFVFRNEGPVAMFISAVYFDDGALLGIASLDESGGTAAGGGVDYSYPGANPPNLPAGNNIDFNATSGFTADPESDGSFKDGVDVGEWLGVIFDLEAGKTFADVEAALALARANPGVDVEGGLRIGIHVQGFPSGNSQSFVNNGMIPLPSGALLGLAGLAPLALRRRR